MAQIESATALEAVNKDEWFPTPDNHLYTFPLDQFDNSTFPKTY